MVLLVLAFLVVAVLRWVVLGILLVGLGYAALRIHFMQSCLLDHAEVLTLLTLPCLRYLCVLPTARFL